MRITPDGSLAYWPAPRPPTKPWDTMTYEEQRQQLIDWLLHYYPTTTPEEAAAAADAFF